MAVVRDVRATLARRGWPVSSAPSGQLGYLFAVDVLALVWGIGALVDSDLTWGALGLLGLLMLLAVGFEEGARRAARIQLRLSADLKRDMISVWAVAGAVALTPASSVLLLVAVLTYVWYRQQRPAGEPLHRKWFNGSTELLGCLVAGVVVRMHSSWWDRLPWALPGAVSVVVAIVVYAAVNRLLVTLALLVLGVRGKAMIGSLDDNLIELATLCLGGLVSLAVLYEPWLAVLVVAPMYTLQRGALVRELETAATIDSKTGLLNAIAWEQLAQRELARAERERYPIAVLIIDIDRFKLVNDTFGHLIGDAVLHAVGRSLSTAMREYDTVGRFGGEEFVAVLPEADESTALIIAERVRARVNQLRVSQVVENLAPADDAVLAVSIGVACLPANGRELAELLHEADQALYRAKSSGRNQVQLARHGEGEDVRVKAYQP